MPCNVTGALKTALPTGSQTPVVGAKLWLVPSRTDFFWTPDSGTTWLPFRPLAGLVGAPPNVFAETKTALDGSFGFAVPYTDDDVHLPAGAPSPALVWSIVDSGGKVYTGPLLSGTVGTDKTLDQLTQLGAPNTWAVAGAATVALPQNQNQLASVTFTDAGDEHAVTFSSAFPDLSYRMLSGAYTDDTSSKTVYAVAIKAGSKTTTGCILKLSAVPPTGANVQVDVEFRR